MSRSSPDPDVAETLGLRPETSRRKTGLVVAAVVAVLGVAAAAVAMMDRPKERWDWETSPVVQGDLVVEVTAVGTLEPLQSFEVGSEVSGRMETVTVETNDRVSEGQVLATLDTELLEAQLRQARAQYASAAASLKQARSTLASTSKVLDRTTQLHAEDVTSASSLDQAQDALDQSQGGVELAQAQLAQARASVQVATTNLERAVVVSPIDGIVLERNVDPGQSVVTSLQAATLFVVAADLSEMSAEVEIDEADVGRIEAGQLATFTVAAYPDRVFEATVAKLELAPRPGSQVVTYLASLHLSNPDGLLRPGMTVTARIATETYEDRVLVPSAGLRFEHPDQDLPMPEPRDGKRVSRLWVLDGAEARPVEVVSSVSDGRSALLEEGDLEPGDEVIVRADGHDE